MKPIDSTQSYEFYQYQPKTKDKKNYPFIMILLFFILGIFLCQFFSLKETDVYQKVNLMPFKTDDQYANAFQVQKTIKQNNVAVIIQIGSWMGKSTIHMGSLLPQNGKLYAVDTWKGSPNQQHDKKILESLYDQFLSNVIHSNLTKKIIPVRLSSGQAGLKLNIFPHMIYLDATHTYEQAKKDIKLWYPFIKDHGILCGDDFSWGDGGVGKAVKQFSQQNQLQFYTNGIFWKLFKR